MLATGASRRLVSSLAAKHRTPVVSCPLYITRRTMVSKKTLFTVPDGTVNLCVGAPNEALLDEHVLPVMQKATAHRLAQPGVATALQYGPVKGSGEFIDELANWLTTSPFKNQPAVKSDNVLTTAGASAGLALIASLMSKHTKTIFVEDPCYFLTPTIFTDHGYEVRGIANDTIAGDGLDLDALEKAMNALPAQTADDKAAGHPRALVYLVASFQNPNGSILTDAKRRRVVDMAYKHNFYIVSDEIYDMLQFDQAAVLPSRMAAYDEGEGRVIGNHSFAKIFAPGMRMGWMEMQPQLLARFLASGQLASSGAANHFTSEVLASALQLDLVNPVLDAFKAVYSERKRVLCDAVRTHFPEGTQMIEPDGGFFVWVSLPAGIDTAELNARCTAEEQVVFVPGVKFSVSGGLRNCLRVSFTHNESHKLEAAMAKIGTIAKSML